MEQFSLEEWLQDKSRKICTRDGRNVRIVCTDSPILHHPIVGFVECDLFTWTDDGKVIYGGKCEDKNDLFFADEEEELTEFEKAIYLYICTIVTACDGNVYGDKELKPIVKGFAKDLLDLARKEIQQEFKEEYSRGYSIGKFDAGEAKVKELVAEFEKGRTSVLKDLPKWKKAYENKEFEVHVCVMDEDMCPFLDTIVNAGEYYIELSDLKILHKE